MSDLRESSSRTIRQREGITSDSRPISEFEGSESSIFSLHETFNSRPKAKKRKTEKEASELQPRMKRLKPYYSDEYRELYNETIDEITFKTVVEEHPLPSSQIGVTTWSSEEKAEFYSILARRGRHDIKAIAANIGSKSESEVYLYLELLQNAIIDQNVSAHRKNLLDIDGIEHAIEINQECCAALDQAAEALSVLQQKEEENVEKHKHAKFSLLATTTAKWLSRSLQAGEEGEKEVLKFLPAATLLDLKAFLAVSKRFFMNSSITELNWRTYAEKRQSPSITYTAFSDIHTLATSLTRRLIQSSLFFAMSRIRALKTSSRYTPKNHVRQQDVIAALGVLGIEPNARKTWTSIARKCRLHVYENVRCRQAWGKRYTYDEVEAILSRDTQGSRGRYRTRSADDSDISRHEDEELDTRPARDIQDELASTDASSAEEDESSTEDTDSSASDSSSVTEPPLLPSPKHTRTQQRLEQAEDAYLEAHDQKASLSEEKRLWEMLGEDPATKMVTTHIDVPPVPRRAARENYANWTTWVDYGAPWEKNETPVHVERFAENRRLEKKEGGGDGLTDVELDEEVEEEEVEEEEEGDETGSQALRDESTHNDSSETDNEASEYGSDSDANRGLSNASGAELRGEDEDMEARTDGSSSAQDSSVIDERGRSEVREESE